MRAKACFWGSFPPAQQLFAVSLAASRFQGDPQIGDELLVLPRSRLFIGLAQQRGGMNGGDRMHTSKILRFSMDLPIATEIVESEQKIQAFLPISDEMIEDVWRQWRRCRRCTTAESRRNDRPMPAHEFVSKRPISARPDSIRGMLKN